MTRQRPLLVANWKANLAPRREAALAVELVSRVAALEGLAERCELFLAPSTLGLTGVARELAGSPIRLAAQDCSSEGPGAHTGETPAEHLAGLVGAVLIGHAERRHAHGERGTLLGRKVGRAIAAGLRPILCLDDVTSDPATGRGSALADEWAAIVAGATAVGYDHDALLASSLVIAYEPVDAIGNGQPLVPDAAQAAAAAIRAVVETRLPVLYGGSITDAGADAYLAPAIDPAGELDGLLVGSASLAPARLAAILTTLVGDRR
jgi:triosephosphate isomerase